MVLQDLGRRINTAVSDLTRAPNLDEKVTIYPHLNQFSNAAPCADLALLSRLSIL